MHLLVTKSLHPHSAVSYYIEGISECVVFFFDLSITVLLSLPGSFVGRPANVRSVSNIMKFKTYWKLFKCWNDYKIFCVMGEWNHGLFACFDDMATCIITYFIPCITYANNARENEGQHQREIWNRWKYVNRFLYHHALPSLCSRPRGTAIGLQKRKRWSSHPTIDGIITVIEQIRQWTMELIKQSGLGETDPASVTKSDVQSDPDLVTSSGERGSVTKSGRALNRAIGLQKRKRWSSHPTIDGIITVIEQIRQWTMELIKQSGLGETDPASVTKSDVQSDPDLVTSSGERGSVTKSGRALNRC
eukprot:sb/3467254/